MPAKMIFIHGISQDPNQMDLLHEKWRKLLIDNATDPQLFEKTPSEMAFYADILGPASKAEIVLMGSGEAPNAKELEFVSAGMREIASAALISDEEIDQAASEQTGQLQVVAQSSALGRALVGTVAALERKLPSAGWVGIRVLKEAYVYLKRPKVQKKVDERVLENLYPALKAKDPVVIVSHSLGTVVAFRLLRALNSSFKPDQIPLLITMGSPLAITAVRNGLGLPRDKPDIVARWENFYDRGDLVALGQGLKETNFGAGMKDDGDVNNTTANAHGIQGYLNHNHVILALEAALNRPEG